MHVRHYVMRNVKMFISNYQKDYFCSQNGLHTIEFPFIICTMNLKGFISPAIKVTL